MAGRSAQASAEASTRVEGRATTAADADTVVWPEEDPVRVQPDGAPTTLRSAVPRTPQERFEDKGELDRGGMGSIRRAYDHTILRSVAVKCLHDAARAVPGASERFLEEAQITGQLEHPNIVPVHDVSFDEAGKPLSFSMKLVRGKTLKERIAEVHERGIEAADFELFVRALLKVCEAVSFAHSRGVIHRDLKPDNVMLGTHGQVYVMDWGIALLQSGTRHVAVPHSSERMDGDPEARVRSVAEPGRAAPAILGTPAYMAPEQARGEISAIDARTDVFGLGGILYRVLTNRAPFFAGSSVQALERAKQGEVTPAETVMAGHRLPPGLCAIVDRALAAERDDRYDTVDDLAHALEAFLRGGGWFRTLDFRAGTVIVREGDAPDAAYIIQQGRCEVYKVVGGEKRSLRVMDVGEAFGETSIFADSPRTASVVAMDDVVLSEITREAFERECSKNTWMRAFLKALSERFVDADRQLTTLQEQRRPDPA